MKQFKNIFCLFITIISSVYAERETKIIFKAEMIKNDGSDRLAITNTSYTNEAIEGYFYLPKYETKIEGAMKKGGFNFLDPQVMGEWEFLREKWTKNDFPVE